jgi:hypothetical protein
MYEIEKNVSAPAERTYNNGGGKQKYPFVDMEVGDSVFIPGATSHDHNACRAARAAVSRKGFKLTTRFMDGGARIWRVS